MDRRLALVLAAIAAFVAGLTLAACGGGDNDNNNEVKGVQAVEGADCGDVQYSGSGTPSKLIVSDLPLRGDSAERSDQQNKAIVQEIAKRGWQAGQNIQVAFQACDDTIASTGDWDEATCKSNARAYASNPDVIGVIGTYNSGCAKLEIPILNNASGGGLAMVSPGNTLVCLTETATSCKSNQPDVFYPTGKRNYARVVPNDAVQSAGMASFAKDQGVTKPFFLIAQEDQTSAGQARTLEGAAKSLGMQIAGVEHFDPEAKSYTDLMQKAKAAGADAVFLGAILEEGGSQLIKDKVAVLGPNDGAVKLLAPDGFAQQSTIDQAGADSAGMFASAPGKEPSSLTGAGSAFVKELKAQIGDKPVETFAPYAGEAAEVMLDAIQKGKDRAGTIAEVFKTNIKDGIIGSIAITPSGDPTPPPISISKAAASFELEQTVVPPPSLINAARGG
ncbi:MAG: branched-chain amino acid ABC transporter substrate-binding protein [Solirubrobacterales bacterium]